LDSTPVYHKKNYSNKNINNVNSLFNNLNLDEGKKQETIDLNSTLSGQEFIFFLKTQKGSRMMQKFVNKRSPEEIYAILEKILNFIKELMCDSYANYFIQKLFQCCTCNQRLEILKRVIIIYFRYSMILYK
jgi:hypothetical protein